MFYRSFRRLSILPELNEEAEPNSPTVEIMMPPLERKQIPLVTVLEPSGEISTKLGFHKSMTSKSESPPRKERTSISFDSFLNQKKNLPRRQLSDSCEILGPHKTASDLQGCLSPRSLNSTSRSRPLKFSMSVSSSSSLDCDSSPTGSEADNQSNTLVPLSSPSPPSLSESDSVPSISLSAMSSSASPTYATPALSQASSPLLSPQCSFYSCSSSPFMSPPSERDNLAPEQFFTRYKSLSVKNKKEKEISPGFQFSDSQLRRVSSVPETSIITK